jgi:hypothetical protein
VKELMPILAIKAKIHADPKTEAVLKDAMLCAAKVFNGLLWHLRKEYFVHQKEPRWGRLFITLDHPTRLKD